MNDRARDREFYEEIVRGEIFYDVNWYETILLSFCPSPEHNEGTEFAVRAPPADLVEQYTLQQGELAVVCVRAVQGLARDETGQLVGGFHVGDWVILEFEGGGVVDLWDLASVNAAMCNYDGNDFEIQVARGTRHKAEKDRLEMAEVQLSSIV